MSARTKTSPHLAAAAQALQAGRLSEAERLCRAVIQVWPTQADAQHLLGVIAARVGRYEAAAAHIQISLRSRPDNAEALANLGGALQKLGRKAEALAANQRAVAVKPGFAGAHLNLGLSLAELGRMEEAAVAFRRARQLDPRLLQAHLRLAVTLQEMGAREAAAAAARRALACDPKSVRGWSVLSDLKTFSADDPDLAAMEALLASAKGAPANDLAELEFALAKAWMDAGDPGRAFARLLAANRRKRALFAYDIEADVAQIDSIGAAFGAGGRTLPANPSSLPIFVIGMPRSGTTLTEQILAAHPDVGAAGETPAFIELLIGALGQSGLRAWPSALGELTDQSITDLGETYLARLSAEAPGKAKVVDKAPGNFRYAGLIARLFPNARVVWPRRDPIDTCFSCFATNFADRVAFANDLTELGRYHRAQERLMLRWQELIPRDRFTEVRYEALVDNLEAEARRLVAFCGLDWDPACLRFHEGRSRVRTASVNQVRRPLYRTSIGRWRPYSAYLGPLLEALGVTVETKVTVPAA
jgi:tetratricopeptide (TPR) repeat protein